MATSYSGRNVPRRAWTPGVPRMGVALAPSAAVCPCRSGASPPPAPLTPRTAPRQGARAELRRGGRSTCKGQDSVARRCNLRGRRPEDRGKRSNDAALAGLEEGEVAMNLTESWIGDKLLGPALRLVRQRPGISSSADDDETFRSTIAMALRSDGFEVSGGAQRPRAARQGGALPGWGGPPRSRSTRSSKRYPDALLLGYGDPGGAPAEVRRRPPVILITAFGQPHLHATARSLGASAVFREAVFDLDDLRSVLFNLKDAPGFDGGYWTVDRRGLTRERASARRGRRSAVRPRERGSPPPSARHSPAPPRSSRACLRHRAVQVAPGVGMSGPRSPGRVSRPSASSAAIRAAPAGGGAGIRTQVR